ncbi:LacI family DNA-binding transcriptional regulator [Terriglobus saanensis]|uniref:Transcriptional regulator, LacI family n=1 Tax=Terriglobus saanensis (strain ATCC BAA-1853 / DSM 23119 / SP1PR4) TaxID=401053 RepID=E8V2P5_TERSS|nr:LacI family DNA-binding transcriptional regulator [Terriglobus saanensis]ADV83520.1 transcriptional regulator, LacI family [Terriglobus saanensis SP1PR4]
MRPIKTNPSPTISDVAKAASVSTATVSRAFSRPEMLRQETVNQVRFHATKLGYLPNLAARALSTGRQGNIAILVPDIANPFFPPLLRAAQATADFAGYSVFLGDSDEDPEREQRLVNKLVMQVEGFILASSRMQNKKILELSERQPVVLINRDTPGLPRVLIDTVAGIDAAVAHLAAFGHQHLVYISGPAASWSDQQRRSAVSNAAARHKMKMQSVPARHPSFDAGREVTSTVLNMDVTAAITFDDFVAHGLLAGLAEQGVLVPRDFSVIGCDDVLGASTYPALTSVSARCDEAGRMAADLLISTLQTGKRGDVRCLLETWLVIRDTTAPAPKTGRPKLKKKVLPKNNLGDLAFTGTRSSV